MNGEYITALEVRARWLRWAREDNAALSTWGTGTYHQALSGYIASLEHGDTFFMNKNFCQMVEHARQTIPDDLAFETSWLHSPQGWLWIESPFQVPVPKDADDEFKRYGVLAKVSAIGWIRTNDGGYHFMMFQTMDAGSSHAGFGCWSYFTLREGDKLIDRIHKFESLTVNQEGAYPKNRASDTMHEMRWLYAAFHLMAQRMTHISEVKTDRHTRRRAERNHQPVSPFVRVISLRRLEEARKQASDRGEINWQWQWGVRGHWRNHYFPAEQVHKPIYIESYVKGPDSKPLKAPQHNIFTAIR